MSSYIDAIIYSCTTLYKTTCHPPLQICTWSLNNERRAEEFHMNLRNNEAMDVPFARLMSLERHLLTRFPKLWFEFNNENVKIIRNKPMFNKELKTFFLDQLNEVVTCDRLFCAQCHPPDRL